MWLFLTLMIMRFHLDSIAFGMLAGARVVAGAGVGMAVGYEAGSGCGSMAHVKSKETATKHKVPMPAFRRAAFRKMPRKPKANATAVYSPNHRKYPALTSIHLG